MINHKFLAMKFVIVLLCSIVALGACAEKKVRYDNYSVYKVHIENEQQLSIAKLLSEAITGFTIWRSYAGIGSDFDIMVSPTVMARFKALSRLYNFRTQLLILNVQTLIDAESKTISTDAAFGWDSYHTLDEIYAWLDEIHEQYPTLTTPFVVGKSYEGRDIRGIKISYPYAYSSVVIEGCTIASEWITAATATYIINDILTNKDSPLGSLASRVEWYIVPVLNVDGYVYSHKYNRLWRKTRKPHIATNCVGVDLSRNFDYMWMENQGGSGIPCSEYYAGTGVLSEPESKAFTTYVRGLRGQVGLFISLRAYGQYILTPYAYSSTVRPKDYNNFLDIAKATVDGIRSKYGTEYEYGAASSVLGIASGNVVDWASTSMPGKAAAFSWVLRDTGRYGYVLPSVYIKAIGEETMSGLTRTVRKSIDYFYLW